MKLKEIVRTATFAWSPDVEPRIATGTVAGALDASFSNDAHLEIWSPDMHDRDTTIGAEGGIAPKGKVTLSSRFNRLAWGYVNPDRPQGVLAAGLESGQLELWDPAQITHETDVSSARLLQNNTHTGPVRALHFNAIQTSLLASGSVGSELYIWDLKNPTTPYTPGARSQRLDGVSALAWNAQVAHILASSSLSGYTVVWDLRGKREVVALQYGSGGGPAGGPGAAQGGGIRRGMSDVAWHPDNATRLITASEDDSQPVIMLWDLRNARAPEKILQGHERGVLSVSWCQQDPELLLSCGKDNRTLIWNPNSGEIVGQLPPSNNWSFLTSWNPRNPDIFATANYDGSIAMHSIQSTSTTSTTSTAPKAPANPNDVFDPANFADTAEAQNLGSSVNLERAPKWLKPPVGARFGFGGVLVEVTNTGEEDKKRGQVQIKQVVGESEVVERAKELIKAEEEEGGMKTFVEARVGKPKEGEEAPRDAKDTYSTLLALFDSDPKSALIKLVGYDASPAALDEALAAVRAKTYEPVVSFAPEATHVPHSPVGEESEGAQDEEGSEGTGTDVPGAAPSEVSAFSSDAKQVDAASTATEPSLFGDDLVDGAPGPAAGDFFNTLASDNDTIPTRPRAALVPHLSYTGESSAAATIGSRASSVAGDAPPTPSFPAKSFRMHPKKEDATSALVTRALITGNLDTAVELCIQAGRWADALLLAQGEGLIMRTRMAYFEQSGDSGGYLRVFKGVVQGKKGLADLVRGSEVGEWREMLVVLCRWAEADSFSNLVGELGERVWAAEMPKEEKREAARVCFMAGKKLERLVAIWEEEAQEEEGQDGNYGVRARAVQSLIEKAVAFSSAVGFVDPDLASSTGTYPLAPLYDLFLEYAQILAAQGMVSEAVRYVERVPAGYGDVQWLKGAFAKKAEVKPAPATTTSTTAGQYGSSYGASSYGGYNPPPAPAGPYGAAPAPTSGSYGVPPAPSGPYGAPSAPPNYGATPVPSTGSYGTPPAPSGPYAPPPSTSTAKPTTSYGPQGGYNPPPPPGQQPGYGAPSQQPYGQQSYQGQQPGFRAPMVPVPPPPSSMVPVPPPPMDQSSGPPPPRIVPASQRRDIPGWNDAPNVTVPQRRTPAPPAPVASAITSPFPNSPAPGSPVTAGPPRGVGTPQRVLSPAGGPPRGMSPHTGPPRAGTGIPPPPRPHSGGYAPPPQGAGQYAPPPQGAGQYAPPSQSSGPYGPPPTQSGGYAPPPGTNPSVPPPPPSGAYAPPPGQSHPPPPAAGPGTNWNPQSGPPPPGSAPRTGTPTAPPARAAPKAPKYPPGDREHIPDSDRIIFEVLSEHLGRLKQNTPPQQKRMVDDIERRLNVLFDALNCESISRPVVEQLLTLIQAMQAHDAQNATSIHVDLLTRGSRTDDIGLWMSGVKQLIIRM
ncbi:protein transporter SEC31 [Rhizoctonia solani 123E]|uniref:Protein transport protein SEC31 n=1 Tax=Rhizoctonia solani 123E TaxID=1423351 RepID=A0A074RTK3_9AGAM|nr:protein transporter SEC31 [Rhizoctonia solani 123E]